MLDGQGPELPADEGPVEVPVTVITADGTMPGVLTNDGHIDYIVIEPNYRVTAWFIAENLASENYESPAATRVAVGSLIEHIRYLTSQGDLEAVSEILDKINPTDLPPVANDVELTELEDSQTNWLDRVPEDDHLEAEYEDRFPEPEV